MTASFHFPYHKADAYWVCVIVTGRADAALEKALAAQGMRKMSEGNLAYIIHTKRPWVETWTALKEILQKHDALEQADFAVVPGEAQPGIEEIAAARKSADAIDVIAENLWLADAIAEERLLCYMQPIMDRRGKSFGYEAFVRLQGKSGEVIGGGKIIAASKDLNLERILDRQLHSLAVNTFAKNGLEGFLFVNFVPGFIMRPEKYLESLANAAQETGMPAKNIVLDVTRAELPHDPMHLKSVLDYCRQKGYLIALDDINSMQHAERLLDVMHPDFIKLDMGLVKNALKPLDFHTIRELTAFAHEKGCMVIAEGVENEDIHKVLLDGGADLFQGYHFAAPFDASKAAKKLAG
jgi:EAL domain-containing protein (putative c-di-GMP-specific phosphodiesterase class I)